MARTHLSGIHLRVNDVALGTSTTASPAGGHTFVLATALPAYGTTLTSAYVAAFTGGDIGVTHLTVMPGGPPILEQHVLPRAQLAQTHAQACLLDHATQLRQLVDTIRHGDSHVTLDVDDATLERVDEAWTPEP